MDRPPESFSFGPFELRTRSRELFKHGIKLKLRPQPFQILSELLSRPGDLVTREELREKLWSSETFVDFEQSLNTSVKELRAVLGDSATEPVYVETVPRLGYRFTGSSKVLEPAARNGASVLPSTEVDLAPVEPPRGKIVTRLLVAAVAMVAGLLAFRWFSFSPPPKVLRINQLTHYAHVEPWGGIHTDGARVFFLEKKEVDNWSLMQVAVAGGDIQPFTAPFRNTRILDVSPDRSEFLVAPFNVPGWDVEFWVLPIVGGAPHRLGDLSGTDAAFSPDGQKIAYSNRDGIYMCSRSGNNAHKIASMPTYSSFLAWSPDGTKIRFTLEDARTEHYSLWEVSSDGSNLHALLSDWNQGANECCGQWSRDGRYFFFVSAKGEPFTRAIGNVWARREKGRFPFWPTPSAPVRLTSAPISFGDVRVSTDDRRLFADGDAYEPRELLRPSEDKKAFSQMIKGTDEVYDAKLSPKGDWLALVLPGWKLWRSRPDGSERTELTAQFPGGADRPEWSPDGSKIVFEGREEGQPSNIYVVSAGGGASQELLPSGRTRQCPDWSPDGESVAYHTLWLTKDSPREESGIFVLNLKTRTSVRLPESEGLSDARWSSDARYIAALAEDYTKVKVFDFQTRSWKEIAHGKSLFHLDRTQDGKYFYFQDVFEKGEPVYRVRVGVWKVERVMSFESLLQSGVVKCRFVGILSDGSPMVLAIRGGFEVYSLDVDLP